MTAPTLKHHVVCVPFPAQGHLNPTLQLAKLFQSKGVHVTFVNSEFNHQRLLASLGTDVLYSQPNLQFEVIPDGLPPSDLGMTQDLTVLLDSFPEAGYAPFRELLSKLNSSSKTPAVSFVIADMCLKFAFRTAHELGLPCAEFWTASACGLRAYKQSGELVRRGILPFKDENFSRDGTLDQRLDIIKGLKNMRLKDLPRTMKVTDREAATLPIRVLDNTSWPPNAFLINTFQELETDVLDVIRAGTTADMYTIGPLHLLAPNFLKNQTLLSDLSLWKKDHKCTQWLDKCGPRSVIYANYGSVVTMTAQQELEFAWGLANCSRPFLWVVRPDLVKGEKSSSFPSDFLAEVKDRSFLTSWCPQNEVLTHPSIGVFLSHCGWNSVLENISAGVPLICWAYRGEQPTNGRYACANWGIGLELSSDPKREEITAVLMEAVEGVKGKEMRRNVIELKEKAAQTTMVGGSSYNSFNNFFEKWFPKSMN